ncbi:protein-tyrosine phosphatase [Strigomonas culicis]|uniref:protein-tyrosine-phosphatase n=1 Tax=Strigomonas culicis TaxID=28005 RepID=S9TB99_9TRYP|nr:protein-tyrosine phosphatase [Strigomonas culicis]|eukprot:EPY15282.1 protein-tyrosine phosphatase [Strigomonas culicis]
MMESVCNAARCEPISEINNFLFLGTWKDADDADLLRKFNIGYVLNVAAELDPATQSAMSAHAKNVINKSIPMKDCHHQDISHNFNDAFAFIEEARQHHSRVLVHCRRGISRSAAIVVAYLMATEQQSYQQALDYVTARRPCVCMNLAFQDVLSEYVPELHWTRPTASNNTDFVCNGESSDGDQQTPPSAPHGISHCSFSAFLDDD